MGYCNQTWQDIWIDLTLQVMMTSPQLGHITMALAPFQPIATKVVRLVDQDALTITYC